MFIHTNKPAHGMVVRYILIYFVLFGCLFSYKMLKIDSIYEYEQIVKWKVFQGYSPGWRSDKAWGDYGGGVNLIAYPMYKQIENVSEDILNKNFFGNIFFMGKIPSRCEVYLGYVTSFLTIPFLITCFALYLFRHKEYFHTAWIMSGVFYIIVNILRLELLL